MQWFMIICTTSAFTCTAAALPTLNSKEIQNIIQPPRIVYQTSVRKSQAKKASEQTPELITNIKNTNIFDQTDDSKENIKETLSILPAPPIILPRREKPKKTDQKKDPEFLFRAVGDYVANIKVGPVLPNGIRPHGFHYDIPSAPVYIPELEEEEDVFKYQQFKNETTIVKYENTAKSAKVSQIAISPPPKVPVYYLPVDDLKSQAKTFDILRGKVLKVMKVPGTLVGVLVILTSDTGNNSVNNDKV